MDKKVFQLIVGLMLIMSACTDRNGASEGNILARVGDYYLYENDLKGALPQNITAKDSLTVAKNFINTWVREKLLLVQAEKNLTPEQMNFDKQIETYRNSLIIYQYEALLISQQIDNDVAESEIEDYYEKNKDNFKLRQSIVNADYVIIDINSPHVKKIKTFLQSTNMNLVDSLETYCELYAERYLINQHQWMSFNELLNIVPIQTSNQESFLLNNRFVEISDDSKQYFVKFLDYSIKDEISPLTFERENIKNIILNKRKIELINKMQNQLFEDALNSDIVEIY
ncbi:MAG: hypothetical protein CVU00_10840 [Bacteroidetes bacterium HGW-Bacteroidetes-17]|jgi:hypothetical protein|nr:MAG: hypothetical protein CVU00_10840 [Bacteroidetes bacterium HGW-Bacteroidetes-17]